MAEVVAEAAVLVYIVGAVANEVSTEVPAVAACSIPDRPEARAFAVQSTDFAAASY